MSERVPDLLVEKLALGELPADEAARVRARLAEEGGDRLAAIEASNAALSAELPASRVAAEVRRRLAVAAEPAPRPRVHWTLPALALAAAAVLLWLWLRPDAVRAPDEAVDDGVPGPIAQAEPVQDDVVRLKGDPRLSLERIGDGVAEPLSDGSAVQAGDLVQGFTIAGDARQGVVVSLDGAGAVTLHFPPKEDGDPTLGTGKVALPSAFELDDAPGFERFVFVTGDDVDVAQVMRAAQRLASRPDARTAPLDVPAAWRQASVLLAK